MKHQRKPVTSLTADQAERLVADAQAGVAKTTLAERYGISLSAVYAHLRAADPEKAEARKHKTGRPDGTARAPRAPLTPERLAAINEAIIAGKSEAEIRKEHGIARSTFFRRRALIAQAPNGTAANANGKPAPVPEPDMTPEQITRVLAILTRLGEKRPDVFTKLGIVQKLAQYPMVLVEVF